MRRCSKCGKVLPESEFYKCGRGLTSWCKHCYKERQLSILERNRQLHPAPYAPTRDEITKLYVEDGHSLKWIAKHFNTNYSLVRKKAIEYGIHIRSISDSCMLGYKLGYVDRSSFKPPTFSDEERKARGDRLRNYKATVKSVGYSLKPNGYYEVTMGENKFRPLHVVIMEEHIGRRLRKDECVHHINQVRTDNRIENLQLMTRSEHSKLHAHKRNNSK